MRTLQVVAAALVVLVIVALSGVGRPEAARSASDGPQGGITVTGVGRVDTVPDEAEFSLGVTTKGQTARAALAANSERMEQLLAALKAAGVAQRDVQTQNVSVGPSYEGDGAPETFAANNTVSVRIRDLDRAGVVLDAASRAGANNVFGPSLTRSNRLELEEKALEDAVANARRRAEVLARAAAVELGRVTAISETVQPGPEAWHAMDTAVAEAPIEKGTQEVQATVSVTFAIE